MNMKMKRVRTKRMRARIGAIGVVLTGSLLCSIGWTATTIAQSDEPKLPEGDGRDIVLTACNQCHGLGNVTEDRRTRSGWQDVVEEMAGLGARVNDDDIKRVVDYLTRYFGRVNVNKAAQQDLQDVLELTSGEAGAIVTYRTREGDFHVLEDMKKVPGLDFSKIEERKNRVAFTG
jgi:competence protein ComEA